MKIKIIVACISLLIAAVFAVLFFVVDREEQDTNTSSSLSLTDETIFEKTDDSISDQTGNDHLTTGLTFEANRFQLFKQFFYSHYKSVDAVCLLDLTHDGYDEMLVMSVPKTGDEWGNKDNYLRVYTVKDGAVELIYEQSIAFNRVGWYLTQKSGISNIVNEYQAVWQGEGSYTCEEFYLTENGKPVSVRKVKKDVHFNDPNNDTIYEQYESQIAQLYGQSFGNVVLLVSTVSDEKVNQSLTAETAFGMRQTPATTKNEGKDVTGTQTTKATQQPNVNNGEKLLTPRDEDYYRLERIMFGSCLFEKPYDSSKDPFLPAFWNGSLLMATFGMKEYDLLTLGVNYIEKFNNGIDNPKDPLNYFDGEGYVAIREDALKYYKENVFNNSRSMSRDPYYDEYGCEYYYYNGWYYFRAEIGGFGEYDAKVASCSQSSNGHYSIRVDLIEYESEVDCTSLVDATLVEMDGRRIWKIYKVSPT